jgi:inhibitor of KinA
VITIYFEKMYPLGDSAIVVQLGSGIQQETHQKVQVLSAYLHKHPIPGMYEYVPAFTSVTIYYDMLEIASLKSNDEQKSPYEMVYSTLKQILISIDSEGKYEPETVEIPVCYGEEFGPDLEHVAKHNGLTPEEVIQLHSQGEYLTYMVGFAPGFPYLGGLSEKLATPRRDAPRLKIPAGTVGIAGMQTGVYPIETPGGWQLIGSTPISLFRPKQHPPTLIKAGNIVRFRPISRSEYDKWTEVEV